jgi:hypothetical protein
MDHSDPWLPARPLWASSPSGLQLFAGSTWKLIRVLAINIWYDLLRGTSLETGMNALLPLKTRLVVL